MSNQVPKSHGPPIATKFGTAVTIYLQAFPEKNSSLKAYKVLIETSRGSFKILRFSGSSSEQENTEFEENYPKTNLDNIGKKISSF